MASIPKAVSNYMKRIASKGGSADSDAQKIARTKNAAKARKAREVKRKANGNA